MLIVLFLAGTPTGVDPTWIVAVLAALLGAGGIGGWLTIRNTNKNLAVEASDKAVSAVEKALDRIEQELQRARDEAEELRQRIAMQDRAHTAELTEAKESARREREQMQLRLEQLQERIDYLEQVVEKYRRRAEDRGEEPPDYQGPERRTGESRDEPPQPPG